MDRRAIITAVVAVLVGFTGWLFYERPEPPFNGVGSPSVVENNPSYFAEIDKGGVVIRVIVISQEELNTGRWGDPKNWVETTTDGSKRKNYASKGYIYDKTRDSFIGKKPTDDAIFDEATAQWELPIVSTEPIVHVASQ